MTAEISEAMRHPNCPSCIEGNLAQARWWPYAPLARYEHMLAADRRVWEAWLAVNPGWAEAVTYDYHLGEGWPGNGNAPPMEASIRRGLTRLRCDAIAATADVVYVCEMKRVAGPGALGQALCYAICLDLDDPQSALIQPMVICEWAHPDLPRLADHLGVGLGIAPPPR